MSSGESGGGMSGDDPNDPNSPTYGGIASSDMMGSFADLVKQAKMLMLHLQLCKTLTKSHLG